MAHLIYTIHVSRLVRGRARRSGGGHGDPPLQAGNAKRAGSVTLELYKQIKGKNLRVTIHP